MDAAGGKSADECWLKTLGLIGAVCAVELCRRQSVASVVAGARLLRPDRRVRWACAEVVSRHPRQGQVRGRGSPPCGVGLVSGPSHNLEGHPTGGNWETG